MSEKKLLPGFRPGGFLGKLYPDGVPAPAPIAPAPVFKRGRLVFAFDATASRSGGWQTAVQLTDTLFTAVPDALDVALAEHGGARVRTFTDFVRNAGKLRKLAAGIECEGGFTRMLPILKSAAG